MPLNLIPPVGFTKVHLNNTLQNIHMWEFVYVCGYMLEARCVPRHTRVYMWRHMHIHTWLKIIHSELLQSTSEPISERNEGTLRSGCRIHLLFNFIGCCWPPSFAAGCPGPQTTSPYTWLSTAVVTCFYQVWYDNESSGNFSICDFP